LTVNVPGAFIKSPSLIYLNWDKLVSGWHDFGVNSPPPAHGSQEVGCFRTWRAAGALPGKQASQIKGGFGWAEFNVGRLAGRDRRPAEAWRGRPHVGRLTAEISLAGESGKDRPTGRTSAGGRRVNLSCALAQSARAREMPNVFSVDHLRL
jgi:hypothetical protein